MKRRNNVLMYGALFGMAFFLATGCGKSGKKAEKMTAEKLLEKTEEATEGKKVGSYDLFMELEMKMDVKVSGMDMGITMSMEMDGSGIEDAETGESYMSADYSMEVLGESIETEMEIYTLFEDDSFVTYTYTEVDDSWKFEDTGMSREEYKEYMENSSTLDMSDYTNLKLADEKETYNDVEVYVLTAEVTGDSMKEFLDMSGSEAMFGELGAEAPDLSGSFENMSIPVTMYINTKTYIPEKMEVDITAMETMMNDLMGEVLAQSLAGSTEEASVDEITVSLPTAYMIMENVSYEKQSIPELPEAAREAVAYAEEESDYLGDYSEEVYVLSYDDWAATVLPLEGFYALEVYDDYLYFETEDELQCISYTLFADMSETEVLEELDAYYTEYYAEHTESGEIEAVLTEVDTDYGTINAYSLNTVDFSDYFAIVPVNDYYIHVEYNDFDYEDTWLDIEDVIPVLINQIVEGDLTESAGILSL